MLLQINQLDWAAGAGIFCADAFVMLSHPPFGIGRPAGVEGSITALDDVAVTGHFLRGFLANKLPNILSDIDG